MIQNEKKTKPISSRNLSCFLWRQSTQCRIRAFKGWENLANSMTRIFIKMPEHENLNPFIKVCCTCDFNFDFPFFDTVVQSTIQIPISRINYLVRMFEPAAVALFVPKLITEWLLPPLLQLSSNSILRVLLRTTLKGLVWCIHTAACLSNLIKLSLLPR